MNTREEEQNRFRTTPAILIRTLLRTSVKFEKVLRAVALVVHGFQPAFGVAHVLVFAVERRMVAGRLRAVHVAVSVVFAEVVQRIVRLHLGHVHRYTIDAIAHGVQFVTGRHVRERFGCVHHHLFGGGKKNEKPV